MHIVDGENDCNIIGLPRAAGPTFPSLIWGSKLFLEYMREELKVDPWAEGNPGEGDGNPLKYSGLENLGQRSLANYSTYGPRESDTAEHTHTCTHREQSRNLMCGSNQSSLKRKPVLNTHWKDSC